MAGAVRERVGPTGVGDDVATRAVDLGARRRRRATASRPACWLCEHDVVDVPGVGTGIADADGAGHVGAVAVDDAAEVDTTSSPRSIDAIGRARVRLRAVRARTR